MPDEDCLVEEHLNPNVRGLPRSGRSPIHAGSTPVAAQHRPLRRSRFVPSPFPKRFFVQKCRECLARGVGLTRSKC